MAGPPAPPPAGVSLRSACLAMLGASLVAGCASTKPSPIVHPVARQGAYTPHAPTPHGRPPAPVTGTPLAAPFTTPAVTGALAELPGWAEEDHAAAFQAFAQACGASHELPMQEACADARSAGRLDEAQARRWFERRFRPARLNGEGVLTAYFAPTYPARTHRDAEFSAPVRPRPASGATTYASLARAEDPPPVADPMQLLTDEAAPPYPGTAPAYASSPVSLLTADRATIETSSPDGALAWMRPEDLFFLQIQGSGVLTLEDGRRMKAIYTADNGRPFTAIARTLVQDGSLAPNSASGDNIRAWLRAHAGPQADTAMRRNARYIFFALQPDDGREPAGAAGVALPPGRSLAVDPGRHAYGELYWIDAEAPVLTGAAKRYRRLALSLDTGAAIRGEVRADLYMGSGDEAGREAGRVRHTLRMVRLVPVEPGA